MKHLKIVYGDITVFDGDVAEFSWQDTETSVQVTGKLRSTAAGGGLVDLLTSVSKKMTESKADTYRTQLAEEASDG